MNKATWMTLALCGLVAVGLATSSLGQSGDKKLTEPEFAPKALMMSGGTAMSALCGVEGITRLRGRWFDLSVDGLPRPVPALAIYHPSFLLRSPTRKNEAWCDLLALQSKLKGIQ